MKSWRAGFLSQTIQTGVRSSLWFISQIKYLKILFNNQQCLVICIYFIVPYFFLLLFSSLCVFFYLVCHFLHVLNIIHVSKLFYPDPIARGYAVQKSPQSVKARNSKYQQYWNHRIWKLKHCADPTKRACLGVLHFISQYDGFFRDP